MQSHTVSFPFITLWYSTYYFQLYESEMWMSHQYICIKVIMIEGKYS